MDDSGHEGGAEAPPDSLIPYAAWMADAVREVALRALDFAAAEGLPGEHHYYLTFRTDHPRTVIPARVRAKYPQEITVVLQHQFDDLVVDRAAGTIGVRLSFGGVSSHLTIPIEAVTAFADPVAKFGLRFEMGPPSAAPEAEEPSEDPVAPPSATPQVVSLDAFRKRKE